MDRNIGIDVLPQLLLLVALRKESVDRNELAPASVSNNRVALRKESVDRNVKWDYPSRV